MFEKKTKKILISAVGTTDPVRGYRDGPMLHIMRNYKPDKVLLFLDKRNAGN